MGKKQLFWPSNGFIHTRIQREIKTSGNMNLSKSRRVLFTKYGIQKWIDAKGFGCEVMKGQALSVRADKKGGSGSQ